MVNTDPQPPGIYFKYIYSFDNIPDHFGGFRHKVKENAYLDRPMYESDNFEFQYHGQWWDIGGAKKTKFFWLIFPLICYLLIAQKQTMFANKKPQSLDNKVRYGPYLKYGFAQNALY